MESASEARDLQAVEAQGRGVHGAAEDEVGRRRQREEHVLQIAGDGDLADRIGDLAVLDPESGGATAVVAGQQVRSRADHLRDEQPLPDLADHLLRRDRARFEIRSEEHTSELQSLMRISYAVFCLKTKTTEQQPS